VACTRPSESDLSAIIIPYRAAIRRASIVALRRLCHGRPRFTGRQSERAMTIRGDKPFNNNVFILRISTDSEINEVVKP
jgi:hypothetical protein